ncbi:MAG: PIN domain-containing protein [Anaerolineae bacterium]|nr:PIN domain-containing protein [Anaerolineae bacterium]
MTQRYVLDAWALLALLQGEEPAASRVKQLLRAAPEADVERFISIINLGEVVYRVGKVKGEAEAWKTLEQIRRLPLTVLPASEKAVFAAVKFKMLHAISYADAFAVAAAEDLAAILVTGDPELAPLKSNIQIEMLERIT